MSRHYTDTEKRLVLDRLIANHGDVPRTATECGLNKRTLYLWLEDPKFTDIATEIAQVKMKNVKNIVHNSDSSPTSPAGEDVSSLPPETIETFQDIHDKLLPIIDILTGRIVEAIDEASLSQRIIALSQLIDRVTKLAALLPPPKEEVIYVDEYEYGVAHHVEKNPPRHLQDSEESSPSNQTGD